MSKGDLVEAIVKSTGGTKSDASKYLGVVLSVITQKVSQGDRVVLPDLGTFDITYRSARKGRNPKTGEVLDIPPARAIKFKVSKKLKDFVKNCDLGA